MGEQRTASKGPFRLSLAKKRQQPAMDPHAAAASLYASPPSSSSSSSTAAASKSSKSPPPLPPPLSAASPSMPSLTAGSASAASSSAASPASFAHEDIDEELLNDQEAMAIAVAASNSWFSSPAPDDDDDSLFSGRHGGDDDDDAESHYDEAWKAQDPIVLGAREALESAEPAFPSADPAANADAKGTSAASAAAAATVGGAPTLATTTAPPLQRGLSRTRTTKQGGGILSRLMRISRKEARAAEAATAAATTSPSSSPSSARPVVVTAAAVPEASTGDIFTTMKTQSPATELPPAGPSAAGAAGADVSKDPLTLRDAGIERVPLMVQDEERPQHGRIHSVEPSLVDDESIADRSELSFVEGGFDIDDDDDEEQGTALDALQDDEQQSVPSSPWQLSGHEAQQPSTASSFKDALSRQASETASLQLQPPGDRGEDDEDDQPTPTATPKATTPDPGQSSYFDNRSTPSAAALRASRQQAGAQSAASPGQRKSTSTSPSQRKSSSSPSQRKSVSPTQQRKKTIPALTTSGSVANGPQLRHYLLRRLVDVELRHELERLWMLASLDEAWQPADPAGLAKRDLACFKLDPHRRAPYLPRTALVRPLARAMLSCPLFGPAVPIEGAAAARSRAAGARKFIDEGLLPLARHLQALSLSDEMDRRPHAYHAQTQTMTSALKGALLSLVAHFLVSSLERQPPSREREREPPLALAGWAWSSVEPPPLAAYMGHRLPANKLRQGGMEVDIVGARARQGSGGSADEFLIAVRRYGHPPSFVVRTEGDFVKLAKGLATELGPRRRVRAVPGPTASGALETQPSSVCGGSTKRNLSSSSLSTGDGTAGGTSRSASVPASLPASGSLSSAKGDGFRRLASGANASQVSMTSTAAAPAPSPSAKRNSFGLLRSPKADVDGDEKRGASRFFSNNRSSSSLASTSTKQGVAAPAAAGPAGSTDETASSETADIESRRKQLRAWLRDALSIRGAGHSDEGRHFLGVAAFGEREMRHATRLDMDARARLDRDNIALRADAARSAAEDVLDLRDELEALGQACLGGGGGGGDGFPKAHEALRSAATFGALPLPYQRAVSWANLRLAYALHGVFVNQAQATSSANFARLQDGYAAVPWKMLALALREPTGLMIAKVRAAMTKPSVVDRLVALVVGEDPSGSSATAATQDYERQVAELKRRLGSALSRKLHDFVWECSDHKKRLIRDAARRADIPLVCAIARGSDKPLLATDGVKRIVAATRTYKAFFATRPAPTPDEVLAKQRANVDVRLITDMQALLRLLSAKRDGAKLRAALKDPAVRQPIEALVEPLLNVVRRVHKSTPPSSSSGSSTDLLNGFKDFIASLIDVLGGLRARVQDPWRSIATLALFLDDAVPAWYAVLHRFASRVPDSHGHGHGHGQSQSQGQGQSLAGRLVQDLFGWLASLGALRLDGSPAAADVVFETCSSAAPSSSEIETGGATSVDALARHLAQQHRARRTRQMEAAARWAAGDIDADHAIQLQGADAGKTRTKPFLLDEAPLRPAASAAMLDVEDRLARAFGEALSHS